MELMMRITLSFSVLCVRVYGEVSGTFVLKTIRSHGGTKFVLGTIRPRERILHGTFVPWTIRCRWLAACQQVLDSLEWWSNAWDMKFNTKKNYHMSIASGKSHPTYLYNLCGHILSSVQIAKYLGITLTDELSWSSHVHSIHSRANSPGLPEEEPSALSCQT